MTPLVSILIPAYNAERTLAASIESALAQTWPHKEILVVNDGSRDATLAVARRYSSPQVHVFDQQNQGAAAARNRAYTAAQGEYLQWLDADDLLDPGKITAQMELVRQGVGPRTLLAGPWGAFHYRIAKARFMPTPLWQDLTPVDWLIHKFEQGVYLQTASWLVSRTLSAEAGPWDTRLLGDDDGEYFCRLLLLSERVRFVPTAYVYYRIPGPATLSYIGSSNRKMDAHFLSMKLHLDRLLAIEDSARTRRAGVRYLQQWLPYFHPDRPDIVGEAQALAARLGGMLDLPSPSPKYAWLDALVGARATKRFRLEYNNRKLATLRTWDRLLSRLPGTRWAAAMPDASRVPLRWEPSEQ